MATGAQPIYVDIELDGYNMDPESLAERVTADTRAIVVQHTFGIPAQMDRIMRIAEEKGIPVIEDCCHTLKSSYMGQLLGTFGVASFYSFEWGKPIVVGLGGSAVANDPELSKKLEESYEEYSNPGIVRRLKLELQYWGFGCLYWPRSYWPVRSLFHTLSKLGAAEGNFSEIDQEGDVAEDFSLRLAPHMRRRLARKIGSIERHATHSRELTEAYRSRIKSDRVQHPNPPDGSDTVYARYPLRVADKRQVLEKARKANVELAEWYSTPIHPISGDALAILHYQSGSCPNAEARAAEVVSLPTHGRVNARYVDRAANLLCNL